MKRTLSVFLAVVMVLSMVAMAVPSSAALDTVKNTGTNTLSANNVGIQVPHFSGSILWNEASGQTTRLSYAYPSGTGENISLKDNPADKTLVLDGVINEDEWGDPILSIDSDYAAKAKQGVPSAENTFYHAHYADGENKLDLAAGLQYDLWMAWDEEFLIVAAKILDPDSCKTLAGENVWDGDCLQLRIDPEGPNSITGTKGLDYNPEKYRYPFNSVTRPVAENGVPGMETYGGLVPNIGIGFVDNTGLEVYDMSQRYDPSEVPIYQADGTLDRIETQWKKGATYASQDASYSNPFGQTFGSFGAVRNPANTRQMYTTYEVAIPWTMMDGSYLEYDKETQKSTLVSADYIPTAGDEFGIVIALLNAGRGGSGYNSWLTWGSGACGDQVTGTDFPTAGGSNSMLLIADELGSKAGCTHEFAEATCIAPETCTICGYERAFSVGHDYALEVVSYPTNVTEGKIIGTCKTCGDVYTAISPAENPSVKQTFVNMNDSRAWNTGSTGGGGGYNYLYVTQDPDTGADTTTPVMVDGVQLSCATTDENGKVILDYTGLRPQTSADRAGTYYYMDDYYKSYSYDYNFRLETDFPTGTNAWGKEFVNERYMTGWYHQFGGAAPYGTGYSYGLSYVAGFFPTEVNSTVGKFLIAEESAVRMNSNDLFEGKIFAESPEIDLGTDWHNITFIFDESNCMAYILCDGELMVGAWDEGFSMKGNDQVSVVRRMHVSCQISDMKTGNTTAFTVEEVVGPTLYTVTCDGQVVGEYEAGATVELPVPAFADGMRFFTWLGADVTRSDYSRTAGTANGRKYTMTMPEANVELTSDWVMVGDVNGDKRIKANDASKLANFMSGNTELTEKQMEAADINLDGRVKANDTSSLNNCISGNSEFTK